MKSRLLDNLRWRGRLIATALGKRYIWGEVEAMARAQGFPIVDVCGNIEPLEFLGRLGAQARLDLAGLDFSPIGNDGPYNVDGLGHFNAEPSVARFMGRLAACSGARHVIELGCYTGWTSTHIALGLKAAGRAGQIACVDISQRYLNVAQANLQHSDLAGSASFICGRSLDRAVQDALPARADIVFIDSSHAYQETLDEIEFYSSRLETNGMIVLHDSINAPGVRRALFESRTRFSMLTFATERSNGLTVLQRLQ
jgi:predicted O-methyltransferase YrrM